MAQELTELVRRAKAGDLAAFEQLFHRFQRRIYRVIYQLVPHEEDATDLTQDVFVRAFEGLSKLREEEAFFVWLHRIALNVCRTHLKRQPRGGVVSLDEPRDGGEDEEQGVEAIADDSPTPAEEFEAGELQRILRRTIAALPSPYREVVILHHLGELELTQIAQILGCGEGTVKSRLARGRAMLKERLGPYV